MIIVARPDIITMRPDFDQQYEIIGGISLLRSLPSFVHKTVKPFSDRLEYIVSIPGAWIDPRHEGEGWLVSGHEQTRGTYFGDK